MLHISLIVGVFTYISYHLGLVLTSMEYFKCHVQEKSALKRREIAITMRGAKKLVLYFIYIIIGI